MERCDAVSGPRGMRKSFAWLAALLMPACIYASDDGRAGRLSQPLTPEQQAILGFERPTLDWSSPSGGLAESTTVTQGAKALAVTGAGWHEIDSVALSSLGSIKSNLGIDVLVPSAPGWGEIRVILIAPSLNMWWAELGSRSLTSLPVGQYSKVTFSLPPSVELALEGNYSDLRLKVVVNGPSLSSPYLLDNIDIADAPPPPPPPPPPPNVASFSLSTPSDVSVDDTFMAATHHLSYFSQARIGEIGEAPALANFGTTATYLQAEAKAYGNIYSTPSVQLDSKTLVQGFVKTAGTVSKQGVGTSDEPVVTGGIFNSTSVTSSVISWDVTWPDVSAGDLNFAAVPTTTDHVVAPGRYSSFNIHDRNRIFLSAGEYFFDSFNTEPQAELHATSGPVFIYVANSFTYKGKLVQDGGNFGQVLVGYLGTSDAFLQAPFLGTMVAPNATIKLERPTSGQHAGSFFGKGIEVASGQHTVLHVPFDFRGLCAVEGVEVEGFDCDGLALEPLGGLGCANSAAAEVPFDPGHMEDGQEACSPGLELVSELDGIEAKTTLAYRTTAVSPKQCVVEYRECDEDGDDTGQSDPDALNSVPPVDSVCEGDPEIAPCCGIDENTIVWDDIGLCQTDADCLLFGKICARLCFAQGCPSGTECLDPSCPQDGTQEARCATPNLNCPAIPTEGPCEERRECGETSPAANSYTGNSDPSAGHLLTGKPASNTGDPAIQTPGEIADPVEQPGSYEDQTDACEVPPATVDPEIDLLPASPEERDIVVGNNKWGVYAKANIDFHGKATPHHLAGQATLDMSGSAGADIGVRVWGNDISVFKAGATAELKTCGGLISREAKVFGFDIDPGYGDELPEVVADCETTFQARDTLSLRASMIRAVGAKKFTDCLGEVTTDFCVNSLGNLQDNSVPGYSPPVNCSGLSGADCVAAKQAYCGTAENRATIPGQWIQLYRANRDAVAANIAEVAAQQQTLIDQMPESVLPFIERHESFTAFHVEFEYPVGPVSVIIEIELAGGWGITGALETQFAGTPATASIKASLTPSLDVTAVAFAGIGLGPVAVGIGGELMLVDLQTPLAAGVTLTQAQEADPRTVPAPITGLPYAFDFGPQTGHWTGDWTFGAGARAEFLSGKIDLQARVRMLFFKKTFKKVIAKWDSSGQLDYQFTGALANDMLLPAEGDADAGWLSEPNYYVDPDALDTTPLATTGGTCVEPDLRACSVVK